MLKLHPSVIFPDNLKASEDLSAIAFLKNYLVIGADEGHEVELLQEENPHSYQRLHSLTLVEKAKKEADIEDICCINSTCYVVGSHSRKRKKMKTDQSYSDNIEDLMKFPKAQPTREVLFQLSLDQETDQLSVQKAFNLSDIIQANDLLKQFIEIPSKENGIDIEGLAFKDNYLFIGFRSPVLRQNYVPVLIANVDDLEDNELRFIQMNGRGIRAMTETNNGFLIIGGPPGDGEGTYNLYFWEGNDMIPGSDIPPIKPLLNLGEIPTYNGLKAEGLALISESPNSFQILVVHDGIKGGTPTIFEASLP